MKCQVPYLIERCTRDLDKMADAANIHNVNNKRSVLYVVKTMCRKKNKDCPGVEHCLNMVENTKDVLSVWNWIRDEMIKKWKR